MNEREEGLIARHLLEHQDEIAVCFKDKEWAKLAALVRYVQHDAPKSLSPTPRSTGTSASAAPGFVCAAATLFRGPGWKPCRADRSPTCVHRSL
jgi:hypothetical protein